MHTLALKLLLICAACLMTTGCGSDEEAAPDTMDSGAKIVRGEKEIVCYERSGGEACWVRFEDGTVCLRSDVYHAYSYSDCRGGSTPRDPAAAETAAYHDSDA